MFDATTKSFSMGPRPGSNRIEIQLRENPELDRAAYRQEHAEPHLEQITMILERE